MKRRQFKSRKQLLVKIGIVFVLCLFLILFTNDASAPSNQASKPNTDSSNQTDNQASTFDKTKYSLTDPASLWVIASKVRPLNSTYAPTDLVTPNVLLRSSSSSSSRLRQEPAKALEDMVNAAKLDGINLGLTSGYRSYQYQISVYNGYVQQYGQAGADKVSARPGTSEHQTGLALDLEPSSGQCSLEICFADLPEGQWLAANAYKYGFVLRYPEGKYSVTGYEFEPWHFRYVGKELSQELRKTGTQTLEEFFNIVPDKQPY